MQYYNKEAVGKRIKKKRKENRITQCNLSERLDYTNERQLQRIENGQTACSVDKLMEIAQILNVSTDFLLFGTEEYTSDTMDVLLAGKSKEQKKFLVKLLKTAVENMYLLC